MPIWLDPSNSKNNFDRNRIRKEVLPVLESLHPGSSLRIASLAERLTHHKKVQEELAILAIKTVHLQNGLCRQSLSKLFLLAALVGKLFVIDDTYLLFHLRFLLLNSFKLFEIDVF